jgi:hypothetical protein
MSQKTSSLLMELAVAVSELEAERGAALAGYAQTRNDLSGVIAQRNELLQACKDALGCMIILQEKHPELWDLNSRTWNTAKLADILGAAITKAIGATPCPTPAQ